eukprot:2556980-Amphidinium_carterae.2
MIIGSLSLKFRQVLALCHACCTLGSQCLALPSSALLRSRVLGTQDLIERDPKLRKGLSQLRSCSEQTKKRTGQTVYSIVALLTCESIDTTAFVSLCHGDCVGTGICPKAATFLRRALLVRVGTCVRLLAKFWPASTDMLSSEFIVDIGPSDAQPSL